MTIDTSDSRWIVNIHGHKCNYGRAQHYSVPPRVRDGDIIVITARDGNVSLPIGKRWLVSNKAVERQANGLYCCLIHPLGID